jgi:hypothetical protein
MPFCRVFDDLSTSQEIASSRFKPIRAFPTDNGEVKPVVTSQNTNRESTSQISNL